MARPRRPRLLPAVAVFALVLLAVAAWLGVRGLLAQRHLAEARTSLVSARESLLEQDPDAARTAIAAAADRTGRARGLTSDPVWRLAAAVPLYGGTAEAVRGLTHAADVLASEVLPQALDAAERLDPAGLRGPDGVVDLAALREATPLVVASAQQAADVLGEVRRAPSQDLPEPVARGREELVGQALELADALDGAAAALQVAPALLGEDRARRYLLLVQQTGESRGTGGLIGGFVEVVAEGGRLTIASTGSNQEPRIRQGQVPVPPDVPADYVARYEDFGAFRTFTNVNLSPDLPVVAKVVRARWQAQGGQPLDAVGVLDPTALAMILQGTGDVPLPDGRSIPPGQLERYLAVGQYAGVPLTRDGQLERKDQLEDVAALVAQRLTGSGETGPVLRGLVEAVQTGHLRLTSEDPALAPVLRERGIDGSLPAGPAPVAYPVVYNDSEGKLDYFLDRSVSYVAGPCQGPDRVATTTVTLTNQAPPLDELPPYLKSRREASTGARIVSNTNRVTLSVYGTLGATLQRTVVDGVVSRPENLNVAQVFAGQEAGLPVWSIVLDLVPGEPRTVALELREPTTAGEVRVPEQPMARPLEVEVSAPVC